MRWFTLCRKPDKTSNNDDTSTSSKSSGYALATVPIPDSPRPYIRGLVAVGSDIYSIGVCSSTSSSVMILDCMSHTWREAPSLPVEPVGISTSVLDGKIYVAARSCEDSSKNLFEVFDTKTQTWDPKPISETKWDFAYSKTTCIDGKFHMVSYSHHDVIAYSPKEGRWDKVGEELRDVLYTLSYCVIENVLYTYNSERVFKWFDTKTRVWRKLNGLVRLPKFHPSCCIQLADYGGKLAVLWVDQSSPSTSGDDYNNIWCAEIALEKKKQESCEIWGEVEWFGHVLTVPATFRFEKVLAATL